MEIPSSCLCFNPTLVRLRQIACVGGWVSDKMFQSHAGSIEALLGLRELLRAARFQSHAGSIEAPLSQRQVYCDVWFQSHAGSIEAPGTGDPVLAVAEVSIPRWFD